MTRSWPRIGQGVDAHGFSDDPDRHLVLAGARIPAEPGLAGHSDGDVVVHAVCDALLGAAGRGDLGAMFGTDDPAYAGVDSQVFLAGVLSQLADDGWRIGNVDCTLVAQRPRLAPHREQMHRSLASLLGLPGEQVSVKATSTDQLGALGRAEGIGCLAVALIVPRDEGPVVDADAVGADQ